MVILRPSYIWDARFLKVKGELNTFKNLFLSNWCPLVMEMRTTVKQRSMENN